MELRRYLHLIRQRLLLVIVATLVGAAVGYVTTSQTSRYSSTATIYVGDRQLNNDAQQFYGLAGLDQIVATFAEMIPTPVIAQQAIDATHVDRSAGQIAAETSAKNVTGTNLINVSVTDHDPVVAAQLANAESQAFTKQVAQYQPGSPSTPGALPSEPAYVFQLAGVSPSPLSTGLTKKVILGAIIGFVLSILLVFLLDYLDLTIRSADDLERRVGLPVLGIVPLQRESVVSGIRRPPVVAPIAGEREPIDG